MICYDSWKTISLDFFSSICFLIKIPLSYEFAHNFKQINKQIYKGFNSPREEFQFKQLNYVVLVFTEVFLCAQRYG